MARYDNSLSDFAVSPTREQLLVDRLVRALVDAVNDEDRRRAARELAKIQIADADGREP